MKDHYVLEKMLQMRHLRNKSKVLPKEQRYSRCAKRQLGLRRLGTALRLDLEWSRKQHTLYWLDSMPKTNNFLILYPLPFLSLINVFAYHTRKGSHGFQICGAKERGSTSIIFISLHLHILCSRSSQSKKNNQRKLQLIGYIIVVRYIQGYNSII